MKEISFCYYKYFICCDRAKTEKIADFSAPTWLIFAGPVTYDTKISPLISTDIPDKSNFKKKACVTVVLNNRKYVIITVINTINIVTIFLVS